MNNYLVINQLWFPRIMLSGLFVLILISCSSPKKDALSTRPNILLIMIDDLNDWVGCMGGHPQVRTPNIDRLASNGMLFTNAHAQTAICNPSRTSIMTGLYPSTTGIYFNTGNIEDSPITAKSVLMTRRFEEEGYYVMGAGKLYNNQEERYMKNFAGRFGGFGPFPDRKLTSYPGHQLWDWGIFPEADSLMPDNRIADWSTEQLQKDLTQPFFMGVGFLRPHVPLYAPQQWFDKYPLNSVKLPLLNPNDLDDLSEYAINVTSLEHIEPPHDWIVENNEWKHLVQSYIACISFVDHQVGKVLDALEKSPYRDNTYILLVSDHGFHLGEKNIWAKQTLWERSTRAPLILSGPGIQEGLTCNRPVQLLDIYPTLLNLVGLSEDPNLEGHSLLPLLEDPNAVWPYIARSSFGPGNYAIRSENFRYIRYLDGSEEFYDHTRDSLEWNNQIESPEMQENIEWHRTFLPDQSHPIVGGGSTGHKAYAASKALLKARETH